MTRWWKENVVKFNGYITSKKVNFHKKKYRNNLLETGNEITSSSMMEKCADKIYNDNETYANMDTKNKKKKTQINWKGKLSDSMGISPAHQ